VSVRGELHSRLWIQAGNTTVRGLAVVNTSGGGILVAGNTGALIEQNYIGTDGTADLGNGWGISIVGGGSHTLRNNVVSGNDGVGIDLSDTSGNVIHGNRIGTNASGTAALGNAQEQGVRVSGSSFGNVIGGPGAGQGNLVSGNVWGVAIFGPAHDNAVEGNRVGTNANGDAAIPNAVIGLRVSGGVDNTLIANHVAGNSGNGILIDSDATGTVVQSNLVGLNAAQTAALAHTGSGIGIGGAAGANTLIANTVSGNLGHGVEIWAGAHHNTLVSNHIGTNSSGTASFGNQLDGVRVQNLAYANRIGLPGQGNTISGNGMAGVTLNSTHDNVVLGNRIGTNDAGTTALPNVGTGVEVGQTSLDRIGGTTAGDGNVISGNGGNGVAVVLASAITIEGNRIGVDESASQRVANGGAGIWANDFNTLTIGGATVAARNVISGNVGDGIRISYCTTCGTAGLHRQRERRRRSPTEATASPSTRPSESGSAGPHLVPATSFRARLAPA
jgi:titin